METPTNTNQYPEVETISFDFTSFPLEKHEKLIEPDNNDEEITVRLANLQADPNSPLYSATSFEQLGLKEDLLKGIYHMKFSKPSKIQERALPLLLQDPPRNFIGQSQSGTGKTAAFVLTMLNRINSNAKQTQALCVAPTRELARQIMTVVRTMGKFTPVTTDFAIRDGVMRRGVIDAHVVVGTPGTIMNLIQRKQLVTEHIKIFAVDEADNMLDSQSLATATVRIKNSMPVTCQLVLFSATWPENVNNFARMFAPEANEIRLQHKELTLDGIKQFYVDCKSLDHKLEVLIAIYSLLTIGQSIIFCRTRRAADEVVAAMQADGHAVISLHGAQDIETRDHTIDEFREGKAKVLISTNVTARGIDISQVNLVINYDLPVDVNMRPDPETYLHRIGRSGRFGRLGASISFVHDKASWEEMNAMQEHFGKEIVRVPTDSLEEVETILRKALK